MTSQLHNVNLVTLESHPNMYRSGCLNLPTTLSECLYCALNFWKTNSPVVTLHLEWKIFRNGFQKRIRRGSIKMNISSVGTPAPGATSGRFSHSASHVAVSQRLLQLNHGYDVSASPGTPSAIRDKKRLIPSRKREEKVALQNLQRRVELGKILHSSVNEDFMRLVFGKKMTLENVPSFLKKITSNRTINYVNDEDCQEDIHDNEFIQEALLWHNIYRRHHNSPSLKISAQLCGKAQAWANHLAHTNTFLYENDKSVGQNIYCRLTSDNQVEVSAQEIVSFWYSCYKNYTYNKEPDVLHININAGNFTQLVWRSTRYFGIGRARSRAGKLLVVANYQPCGNVSGLFKENVLPPSVNKEFM